MQWLRFSLALPTLCILIYTVAHIDPASILHTSALSQGTGSDASQELGSSWSQAPSADLQEAQTCRLKGTVDDCCNCTYEAVDQINQHHLHPILTELVSTPYFRYFKVNLYCDCPLWPEDGMCAQRACSVCECEPNEVPQPWLQAEKQSCEAEPVEEPCSHEECAIQKESVVDRSMDPTIKHNLVSMKGWRGYNNPWMADGDDDEEYSYINLLVNPERYTGYKGEHAHRIWNAIYSQSCFSTINCEEKRIFHRLISGTHASISAHLSYDYLLDEAKGIWGPNLQEFQRRLGNANVRDRVENLYFAYLFVLRAVMKAGALLQQIPYDTGMATEDARTSELLRQLVNSPELQKACPVPFDEARLWKGEEGPELKQQLQTAFKNITSIMDCVGCEKCKLWGKLQTLGIATALKILFNEEDCSAAGTPAEQMNKSLRLERNEVIALVNLLERYSKSLQIYTSLSNNMQQEAGVSPSVSGAQSVL